MKIIKQGSLPSEKIVRFECRNCGCVFECEMWEVKTENHRNETSYSHACPHCVKTEWSDDVREAGAEVAATDAAPVSDEDATGEVGPDDSGICELKVRDWTDQVTFYECSKGGHLIATRNEPKYCCECGAKVGKIDRRGYREAIE